MFLVQLLSKPGKTVFRNVGKREILSLKEWNEVQDGWSLGSRKEWCWEMMLVPSSGATLWRSSCGICT